ncbi:MAG: sigma-70 family RNA polymerase sigma factor [Planctomycetes bacterium]|nr:sigma-70 family RNA polymerase sigma factor [Planctomycetota bacterium]
MTERDTTSDAALSRAWHELQAALRAFFARRVAAADVDDLVQECFLRVSQGIAALREQDRLGAWVFRIARNLVTDHRRRHRTGDGEPLAGEDVIAAPDEPDANARVAEWLASMIGRLPAEYAGVLRESELHDVPHREIAERLGMSISGVKSRVQRGRAMLRDELLACCVLQFDARGRVHDYERRSCDSCDC